MGSTAPCSAVPWLYSYLCKCMKQRTKMDNKISTFVGDILGKGDYFFIKINKFQCIGNSVIVKQRKGVDY